MKRAATILSLAIIAGCATNKEAPAVAAPDNPDTDIFVAAVDFSGGAPTIGEIQNASNRKGYDNQPWFLNGEAAFYYVAEGESGKTDIRLYDIARDASQPVTATTDESEYSPKEAPMGGLSYIQENSSGEVTRVHHRAAGADTGSPVVDFAPLGYYAWLEDGEALGVYYRSQPGSLYHVDIAGGQKKMLHAKIGRTLLSNPKGDTLLFSELLDDDGALGIARYDSSSAQVKSLFSLPDGATDFSVVFDKEGDAAGYLAGSGTQIFWRKADALSWAPVADLSDAGAQAASRIAVSTDQKWIAIVGEIIN